MTQEMYKLLHVVGVLVLFLGLGGILAAGGEKAPKLATVLHGIGALAALVGGIGFAHKSELGMPTWVWAKIAAWLLLGAMPFLLGRRLLPRPVAWLLALGIAAGGAWLGLANPKPF